MDVQTTDLYLSAYLVSNQINPIKVMRNRANKKIMFIFPNSEKTNHLVSSYNDGYAMANITQYKNHLEYVKDLMFSSLRVPQQ